MDADTLPDPGMPTVGDRRLVDRISNVGLVLIGCTTRAGLTRRLAG